MSVHENKDVLATPAAEDGKADEGDFGDMDPAEKVEVTGKRRSKMTASYRHYRRDTMQTQLKALHWRVKKQSTLITTLLQTTESEAVTAETNNLDRMFQELSDMHNEFLTCVDEEQGPSQEEVEENIRQEEWFVKVEDAYFEVKSEVCNWMKGIERERDGSIKSSRSNRSGKSSSKATSVRSSLSNKSVEQKAKIASLKAEMENLKVTKEADLNAKLSQLNLKIAKAEAKENVFSQELGKKDEGRHPSLGGECSGVSEWQQAVVDMVKLQRAPAVELDVFSGNPLEYEYFKATFQEAVGSVIPDQKGKLTRLIQSTSGEPKELIKHLVHTDKGFDKAMKVLDAEYGNEHLLANSYLKELRSWPAVKQNDADALKKFHRFLIKCQAYKSGPKLRELDSPELIRILILKLHTTYQERWNRVADKTRRKKRCEPNFDNFVEFVSEEKSVLCNPTYSRTALLETNLKVNSVHFDDSATQVTTITLCSSCAGDHDIEDCEAYINLSLDDRHKHIFSQRLCFGCLQAMEPGHTAKTCEDKRTCKVCNELHPTTLHGGRSIKACHSLTPLDEVISMAIVPVELWHKEHGSKVTVYALLDACSQGTFLRDDMMHSMGLSHRETTIKVETAIGDIHTGAYAVEGLVVKGIPSFAAHYKTGEVELPCTYTRPSLAMGENEIPTPEKIAPWKYLEVIADRIPDYDPTIPFALMIGANCPKATEPLETVPSQQNGPYAQRTVLGWCVIGPIQRSSGQDKLNVNFTRVTVPARDSLSGELAGHYFCQETSIQDTYTSKLLHEMYTNEFNEKDGERKCMSVEDERFIKIMEKGISRRGSHYELPLPFRDQCVSMPDNATQVKKRLFYLKKRFTLDPQFREEYTCNMNSFIQQHARVADTSEDRPGKQWYIPHHGVRNENKGKLRVVFDCASKFQGRCLNDELLQGPDLTNSLIGVLIRFSKEDVAFTADIEAMYHQVKVPENQQRFLRLFWWPDGDIDKEPTVYEVGVHLFGAVSSAGCANFALKQAARDGMEKFGPKAASTVMRDFYVDDCCKSVDDPATGKDLIVATQGLCQAGGFNLTKVVSNDHTVI